MSPRVAVAAVIVTLLGFSDLATGQCIGDDNLVAPPGVPCCSPAQPLLPSFPGLLIPSDAACLLDCGVESQSPVPVFFTAPFPLFPDFYLCQVVMGPPLPVNPTFVLMKYGRTWMEAGGSGPRQVWRFMINTDLSFSPGGAGPIPCPMPACAGLSMNPPRPVHFMGHLDYAFDCNNGTWSASFSLTHFCAYFMHGPQSQRPLTGAAAHPDRSYAIVGPAPFVFGPTVAPVGFLAADSQRSDHIDLNATPLQWDCLREQSIGGSLCGGGTFTCPCALGTTPGTLWGAFAIGWSVLCQSNVVSSFMPTPLPPYLPQGVGYLSLGTFGGAPGTFPGNRQLETWFGVAASADPCQSTFFSLPFHVVHAVSHHGGDLGTTFLNENGTSVTTDRFIDFENMLIPTPSAPGGATIGIGSLFISSQVWGVCLV